MLNELRKYYPLLMFCFTAATAAAQVPVKEKQVPLEIRDDFALRFHEAEKVVWLMAGEQHFGASCLVKGAQVDVVYEAKGGHWIQTTETIPVNMLPDSAIAFCKTWYPDFVTEKVEKVSTRKYGILYDLKAFQGVKQVEITFDMHGKVVQKQESEKTEPSPEVTPQQEAKPRDLFKKS
jgi:hypothetical protein